MEALSVYRHPVPSEALGDLQRASLPSLRAKGLVMEDEGGVWTHDLMVGFFLSRLGAERARETHAAAARYCASRQDLDWGMEALMHAVEADERGLARELVARDGEELALAFPQEAEALLLRMAEWKEMREQEQTLSALALAQEELGHDAQALGTYERLSGQLELAGDERLARALERKARLEAEMRRWAQAFDSHERALRLYQESKDATGEAREWLSLGSAYRRRGDYDKARDAFQKSRDLAEGIGDPAAEAAALNDLALVDWDEGGVLRAEELLELSVAKAHQAGDATGEGLALENLASLLRSQTREEQAQRRLEEAASAFRRAGDEGERKRAVASRAELLGIMGREDEAIALLKETIASEQARRGIRRIGRGAGPSKGEFGLRSALVRLQREAGSLEEAVTEAVQLERAATLMGDDRLLAKARIEMAAALEEMGRADEADEALQQARADLSRKGDAEGLAVVLMRRAALARRRGDNPISEEMLREALHQAKLSGSRFAEASVLEELGGSLEGEERRRLLHMALESYSQIRRKTDAERVRGMLEKVD